MKKKYSIAPLLLIFVLALPASSGAGAPASNKHFFWKVHGAAGTVYILGSIHYLKKNIYPLDRVIEDAFLKSNVLAVEANVDDLSRVDMENLMARVFYQDEDSLEKHLSSETYELLKRELGEYGIPIELVSRERPWFVSLTLTSLELLKLGFDPDYGIDRHFLSEAGGTKRIEELESVNYQIDLLSSFSDPDQELFLLYTLQDLHLVSRESDELLRAWRSGDTRLMESLVFRDDISGRQISRVYEKLLYERNRNMASRIEAFLRTKDTYFVVVGAAHLIGTKGVVETLRRKGYAIEQW